LVEAEKANTLLEVSIPATRGLGAEIPNFPGETTHPVGKLEPVVLSKLSENIICWPLAVVAKITSRATYDRIVFICAITQL
jgi:hypothetical protein